MRPIVKYAIVTLVVAIPAFLLAPQTPMGQAVWPEPNHDAEPVGLQLPLFMLMGAIEAVAFGFAVAFLVFGMSATQHVFGDTGFARWAHVAIAWLFGNFWLHDNLHFINGLDLGGLLVIDYVFHGSLIAAGILLASGILRIARGGTPRPAASTAPEGTPA